MRDHVDLGEALGILDMERPPRSPVPVCHSHGAGARLERALVNFMLDVHTTSTVTPNAPAVYRQPHGAFGTNQLPKFEDDLFFLNDERALALIPTAEVPVTNYFSEEILDAKDLPKHYTAYTPCFRSEAGSYGRDTRGLIRQHQFEKVELIKLALPENSDEEHEKLTANAERILQLLGLPYRTVVLSTGDMGFGAAKTYDLEVWLPPRTPIARSRAARTADFQARRRTCASVAPGRQTRIRPYIERLRPRRRPDVGRDIGELPAERWSILIPEVLQRYMNGLEKIG